MKRKITVFLVAAAPSAIALLAAAFVSFASGSPSSSGQYGSAATASAPTGAAGAAAVGTANSPLGRIVVDNKGRTLYLVGKDTNRRGACHGPCEKHWPPPRRAALGSR
jgi:hypothetical protein